MRISDLSRQTGVPVATIKFYLREGLLPPGTRTGRNQATYGETHLRRLMLIRALTNVGQLDLTSVHTLLTTIDDEKIPLTELYEIIDRVLFPQSSTSAGSGTPERTRADVERARVDVDRFVAGLDWHVESDAPGRARLALVLATLRSLGCGSGIDFFTPYAEAAERLAIQELNLLPPDGEGVDRAATVARSILLEVALTAMRRMAQEHLVALRFGDPANSPSA